MDYPNEEKGKEKVNERYNDCSLVPNDGHVFVVFKGNDIFSQDKLILDFCCKKYVFSRKEYFDLSSKNVTRI